MTSSTTRSAAVANQLLQQEEARLAALQQCTERSTQLRDSMLAIVDSFEGRLSVLEETVLPLYEQTARLQRRQQNIQRTRQALDTTLSYYVVANEVDLNLRDADPATNLHAYLRQLDKLRGAIEFFGREHAYKTQLETASSSYGHGCARLKEEFRKLIDRSNIEKHLLKSLVGASYTVSANKFVELEQRHANRADLIDKQRAIVDWFTENAHDTAELSSLHDEYSRARATVLTAGIRHIHDVNISQTLPSTTRASIGASGNKPGDKYDLTSSGREAGQLDAHVFLTTLAALLPMLSQEATVCARIFGTSSRPAAHALKAIARPPTELVLEYADTAVSSVTRSLQDGKHSSTLALLPVAHYLHTNFSVVESTLKVGGADVQRQLVDTVRRVDATVIKALESLIETIKNDQDRFVPRDGTVHQVTSNTVSFMRHMMHYEEALRVTLSDGRPEKESGVLAKLFSRMLSALGLNVRNKSSLYNNDVALKALFLLNNFNHIRNALTECGVMKCVCEANREVAGYYAEQLAEHVGALVNTWARCVSTMLPIGANLPADKLKDIVKHAFSSFNKEFEALLKAQREYSVADVNQARVIRREIGAKVLPAYTHFYNAYHDTAFSKNPSKYVRHTPQDVSDSIDRLFDIAADRTTTKL